MRFPRKASLAGGLILMALTFLLFRPAPTRTQGSDGAMDVDCDASTPTIIETSCEYPPDGIIDLVDILRSIGQFANRCQA
jgi:hypothetical protein